MLIVFFPDESYREHGQVLLKHTSEPCPVPSGTAVPRLKHITNCPSLASSTTAPSTPAEKPGNAEIIPFVMSHFPACLGFQTHPAWYFEFPPSSRRALPVRGEFFLLLLPTWKMMCRNLPTHSHHLLEFKQTLFVTDFILKHDARVVTAKRTPPFYI